MCKEEQTNKQARLLSLRWWREDPERWRWAGTIAVVFALMGAFAYQNPQIWQNTDPPQLAEEENNTVPEETNLPMPVTAEIPEPPSDAGADGAAALVLAKGDAAPPDAPAAAAAAAPEPEPESPGDEVVAVSAPPTTWQPPASGNWTRAYGYGLDPTLGDYRHHNGCDMELAEGAPVFAVAAGRVVHAADDAAWGGLVIIEHGGGWRSVYKCLRPAVKAGTEIAAGEVVGTVLASPPTEKAQESHLHFEMALDNYNQDPQQWI